MLVPHQPQHGPGPLVRVLPHEGVPADHQPTLHPTTDRCGRGVAHQDVLLADPELRTVARVRRPHVLSGQHGDFVLVGADHLELEADGVVVGFGCQHCGTDDCRRRGIYVGYKSLKDFKI